MEYMWEKLYKDIIINGEHKHKKVQKKENMDMVGQINQRGINEYNE